MSEPTDSKSIKMDSLTNQLDENKRNIIENLQLIQNKQELKWIKFNKQ